MYHALYRKYRPRRFDDVAGQNHITETLRRQIELGRLSHAYLFVGTRGTGKTSCAKILARAVNCEASVDGEPCNVCASCAGIENGSILDVQELDAASNNGVDYVRALREEAVYSPASVSKRVYIIDEVHMLSTSAFNALLKILEEPPEHLLFILATTELHKIPATILSRCQRFSFKRLTLGAISERLGAIAKSEGLALSGEAAEQLASLADGSMRDAISLLDQCSADVTIDLQRVVDTIGLASRREVVHLAGAIAGGDTIAALGALDRLYDDGRDMQSLLNEMAALMRDILVFQLDKSSPLLSGAYIREDISALSERLAHEKLFHSLELMRETLYAISRGERVKVAVQMCLIRMCDEKLSDSIPALLSRVAKLEEMKAAGFEGREEKNEVSIAKSEEKEEKNEAGEEPEKEEPIKEEPEKEEPEEEKPKEETFGNAAQAPRSSEADFWQDILALLKSSRPVYAVLSKETRCRAEFRDNSLIVYAADQTTVNQLKSQMFSEKLRDAADRTLGSEVSIRVEADEESFIEEKHRKLDLFIETHKEQVNVE